MTTPTEGFPIDDIAEHSAWMRRLARALVGEAAADDVVQDTWVQLGERRERPGYLAAVVRSLSLRRQRSERRRKRREDRVTKDELPSTAEIAARSEIVRKLAAAIDKLEEPYKGTIVLRYFDELSAAEIARRSGTPAATVRARLQRGLEQLRNSLDRQGDREHWLAALVPWVGPVDQTPLQASSALAAIVAMKTILLSLAAATVLVSAWILFPDTKQPPAPTTASTTSEVQAPSHDPGDRRNNDGNELRQAVPAQPSTPPSQETAKVELGVIEARVVDSHHYPLPIAWLELADGTRTECDAEGRVRLELDLDRLRELTTQYSDRGLDVLVGARGHRTRRVIAARPAGRTNMHLGDLVLEPGGSVAGRIVDVNGRGVEGATVLFDEPSPDARNDSGPSRRTPPHYQTGLGDDQPAVTGTSGPGGRFLLEGVPMGFGEAWARTKTGLWTRSKPIGVRSGESVDGIELIVHDSRDHTITGRVVDPAGNALPGYELVLPTDWSAFQTTTTDAHGRFHIVRQDNKTCTIVAHAPNPAWRDQRLESVAVGTHNLEIRFRPTSWMTVAVTDIDGSPIKNGDVVGVPATGSVGRWLPRCRSQLDDDGVVRLRGQTEDLRIRVTAPGYRDKIVGPFQADAFPEPLTVTLERVPALTGHVRLPGGEPAKGATVSLHHAASGPMHFTIGNWLGDGAPFIYQLLRQPVVTVTADANGEFRLPLPGIDARAEETRAAPPLGQQGYSFLMGKDWFVHAATAGSATITSGPHTFPASDKKELELLLPPGGSIAGQLRLGPRMSPAGWTIYASDARGELARADVNPDGTFEFSNLHSGGWQLRAFEPGVRGPGTNGMSLTKNAPKPDVEVEAGKTAKFTYEVERRFNARLVGSIHIDGVAPGPLVVDVSTRVPHRRVMRYQCRLDPDGAFELPLPSGMHTSITFHLAGEDSEDVIWVTAKPVITVGVNNWKLDLRTTRITGTFEPAANAAKPTSLNYRTRGGDWTATVGWQAKAGRFGPRRVLAGRGTLVATPTSSNPSDTVLIKVDLAPGKEHDLGTLRN